MQKSFIERIFPHSQNSLLPVHEHNPSTLTSSRSPPRINLRDSSNRRSSHSSSTSLSLQSAPLSASLIHHEDPLLPIERATKNLERTIQSFLDAQSAGLDAGLGGRDADDVSSVGSPTPTPSVTLPSSVDARLKTIPVRQPTTSRITLKGARKGLTKSMFTFAKMKGEELRVLETESQSREEALSQTQRFEDKRKSIQKRIESITNNETGSAASSLRGEAGKLEQEIQELENKLFEMKARQSRLVNQAEQLESSTESKLSSYKSSLTMVDKEVKHFLARPPVTQGLTDSNVSGFHTGMYTLKPERRSLRMAQEQWTAEKETLVQRKLEVEEERKALEEGAQMWRKALKQITNFERELKAQTRTLSDSQIREMLPAGHTNSSTKSVDRDTSMDVVLTHLSEVITFLESDLAYAESKHWNLLICCLGAELEAFQEAQRLLQPSSNSTVTQRANIPDNAETDVNSVDGPLESSVRNLKSLNINALRSSSADSNQSLEETLKEFGNESRDRVSQRDLLDGDINGFQQSLSEKPNIPTSIHKTVDARSESEDDDPGPDFFLSQT